ncbi:MAG: hypothetical protein U0836_12255 [Pirellulales bacterium]
MKTNRVWRKVAGTAAALLLASGPAWAEIGINNRLPCPNGACVPNRMTFGYYPTRWRKWPISPAPNAGPEAAARAGVQPPATNEPPPVNEDEIRSPFERLPQRQPAQAPAEGEYEPLPGPAAGPPGAEREGDGSGEQGNGGGRQGPGAPRRPPVDRPRVFQDPRGNRLPETRRPINDGTDLSDPSDVFGSLALEPPALLAPPAARPVSYAAGVPKQPKKLEATAARKVPTPRPRAAAGNPLRRGSEAARPNPPTQVEESNDGEGPQILPTAAWIEEAASKPAATPGDPAATSVSQWRANPLRGR